MSTYTPVQELLYHPGRARDIRLWIKRDDLLHPLISGNKWRKLSPLLQRAATSGLRGVLSFGGPFSNHLHALAAAGRDFNFDTVAIVRGTAADFNNPTLAFARDCGMQLHSVPKRTYDAGLSHPEMQALLSQYDGFEILPEGGATETAVQSCSLISRELLQQPPFDLQSPDFVCVPAGTGCTAAGVISGFKGVAHTLVFPATAAGFSTAHLSRLGVGQEDAFTIVSRFDFGGFAKTDASLIEFIRTLKEQEDVLLDPLYTGKMMFGVYQLLREHFFPTGSRIVAIHTGGLQGWDGFLQRYGISADGLLG